MKVKLDDYDVRTLVNGLYQQRSDYDDDTNAAIDTLILRLADISDTCRSIRAERRKSPLSRLKSSSSAMFSTSGGIENCKPARISVPKLLVN